MILLLLLFLHTGLKLVKQQAPLSNQPHTDDKMLQQTNVKTVALCGFCVAVVIFMVILQRRYLFQPLTICCTKRKTEWVDSVVRQRKCGSFNKVKVKGKGRVLAIALLTRELVNRSALQSRKWQLIGTSQWYRGALCGHPLPALWTIGPAVQHADTPVPQSTTVGLHPV